MGLERKLVIISMSFLFGIFKEWFRLSENDGDVLSGFKDRDGSLVITFSSGWDKFSTKVSQKNADKLSRWLEKQYPRTTTRGTLVSIQKKVE